MHKSYRDKSLEELKLIARDSPSYSGLAIEAQKELDRREFWRKDIISWVALFFSFISIVMHIYNFIYKI